MPDNRSKRPLPAVMNVGTFQQRFGTDKACWEHLRNIRWGPNLERFTCPDCGHTQGWWLENRRLVECSQCHRQTSVTAGTVFHRARVPLWKWFWAIYQLAQDKKGIAALTLAKQIGVCYATAWLMLHKLRRAMRHRDERYVLQGLVEVDETYVGGEEPGRRGRPGPDSDKKVPVAVALELDEEGKPRRVAMASMKRADGHCLKRFARRAIAQGSTLRTDGWGAYRSVAKAGYAHRSVVTGSGRRAVETFPWIHTFIGNMKRMILGTHHWVSSKHVDDYLAEFTYRANRRWLEASLFDRLIEAALGCKAITCKALTTGVT
jgi:transposase-like protein